MPSRSSPVRSAERRRAVFLAIATGLFAYVSLVPFYYLQPVALPTGLPPFHVTKYIPFLLVPLLAVVAGVARRSPTSRDRLPHLPALVVAVYLAVGLLSLSNADYVGVGLAKWLYYGVTGCLLGLIVAIGTTSWQEVRGLVNVMVCIAGLVAAHTVMSALLGKDYMWGDVHEAHNPYYSHIRAVGPFGNPVSTATYLVILLPCMAWTAARASSMRARALSLVVLSLSLLAILLTQTRAAVVESGVVLLASLPLLKRAWQQQARAVRIGLAVAGVAVLAVMGMTQTERLRETAERWRHLLSPKDVTVTQGDLTYHYGSLLAYTERFRVAQYYTTLKILREHPLLGVGFGNFSRVFPDYQYAENYDTREFAIHTTDNMYLMVLAETGSLGLLATMVMLGMPFLAALRGWQRHPSGPSRDLLLAFLASSSGVFVTMLAWDLFNDPTIRIAFWMLAGLALSTTRLAAEADT